MKAEWIYSIIKSLEARLEYFKNDDETNEEVKVIEKALEFFKSLEIKEVNMILKK